MPLETMGALAAGALDGVCGRLHERPAAGVILWSPPQTAVDAGGNMLQSSHPTQRTSMQPSPDECESWSQANHVQF